MLADPVAVANAQVAALAGEVFVERIGAEHGAGRDFVVLAERRPALHIDVWLKHAAHAEHDVLLDHRVLADVALGSDARLRMDARRGGDVGRRVNWHKLLSYKPYRTNNAMKVSEIAHGLGLPVEGHAGLTRYESI
jgi:hypothetical protein